MNGKSRITKLAKNGKTKTKNENCSCDAVSKLPVRNEYFNISPFTPPYCMGKLGETGKAGETTCIMLQRRNNKLGSAVWIAGEV